MTKEQAIALRESNFWQGMSDREIAEFQMIESESCMPFHVFHEALEKTLGRPVSTHELRLNADGIGDELFKGKQPPTLEEVINMIPIEKRIVVIPIGELL